MEQQRFTGLMDMLDGGGMGAKGDEFKGGGLLSDIGNALFQPAGYRERMRGMQETRPMARPQGMTQPQPQSQPQPMAQSTPMQPGPMMPGGPTPPTPMQSQPQMPQDPAMPSMPTAGANPMSPGPMMPGGPMPQETPAPAPMGVDAAMAQLEGALTPGERQTLQGMSPDQRMGMIQRLIQMRQGGM